MKTHPSVVMLAANNDIVELLAHGRLYWVTRKRFEEIETVSRMLGTAISRGASLSTVQHIFDEPLTGIADIRVKIGLSDQSSPADAAF